MHVLPENHHRLVANRAASPASAAELASALWPLLLALRACCTTLDLFSGYDEIFQIVPVNDEETLARLLDGGEIEWHGPRPPGEPTHATRLFNGKDGAHFADLYVRWIQGSEAGSAGLSVELRLGRDPEVRQALLLRQAFEGLVQAVAPTVAFGETCFQTPRAKERSLSPWPAWLTFVPARLGAPPSFEAPTEVDALEGLGAVVVAVPGALDDDAAGAGIRKRVAALLEPKLGAPPAKRVEASVPPPGVASGAAPSGAALPSYLRAPAEAKRIEPVVHAVAEAAAPSVPTAPPKAPQMPQVPAVVMPPAVVQQSAASSCACGPVARGPAAAGQGPAGIPALGVGPSAPLAVGQVRCATLGWRIEGAYYLTTIVKASFVLRPGGGLSLTDPAPVQLTDAYHNGPLSSLQDPSDLVPYLPSAEVMLTGHAVVPRGGRGTVRLSVHRLHPGRTSPEVLVDKRLVVRGDGDAGGAADGLVRVPLRYEHARGGPGNADNPVGVGHGPGDPSPRLVHPDDPSVAACFGPISPLWASRARTVSSEEREGLRQSLPSLPASFSWAYYMAVPPDQRITGFLRGDEVLILEGFGPDRGRVEARLPGLSARCLVWAPDAPPEVVQLAADTLRVDVDRGVVSVTWRGYMPVRGEGAFPRLVAAGALSLPTEAVHWPTPAVIEDVRQRFRQQSTTGAVARAPVHLGMTADLPDGAPSSGPMPFAPSAPSSPSAPPSVRPAAPPGSPLWSDARPAPRVTARQRETVAISAVPEPEVPVEESSSTRGPSEKT
ncbi:DUF2169 domain-containing protein [Chondromyces crocatus]|uniref:DUF2169 domain-containing protein n=1 Tax=Chondromyces crocatus TaxID=52 RepID=A0A0K1ED86_CHOCO|nr:DUF2169 domain-containing protein [Chondromyces crocatus]AKT38841.1 uncharacterized protein CMC5_029870 [Chondromyces crocatus]